MQHNRRRQHRSLGPGKLRISQQWQDAKKAASFWDVPGCKARGGRMHPLGHQPTGIQIGTLWWTNILPWKITIFNGQIHYFYGHFP